MTKKYDLGNIKGPPGEFDQSTLSDLLGESLILKDGKIEVSQEWLNTQVIYPSLSINENVLKVTYKEGSNLAVP